jgi:hypothetical protein
VNLVVGLLLLGGVLALVAPPLLRPRPTAPAAAGGEDDHRLRLLAELEYDYRMGKLDAEEYRRQRARLQQAD